MERNSSASGAVFLQRLNCKAICFVRFCPVEVDAVALPSSPELHEKVRARFESHMTERGAEFEAPFRVDLLHKT
jgi:hypothetical protein